jgi:hypothetical protein
MTPNDFKDRYLSVDGGFGSRRILWQSAWFRFHNRVKAFRGLRRAWGAHPGAGLLA